MQSLLPLLPRHDCMDGSRDGYIGPRDATHHHHVEYTTGDASNQKPSSLGWVKKGGDDDDEDNDFLPIGEDLSEGLMEWGNDTHQSSSNTVTATTTAIPNSSGSGVDDKAMAREDGPDLSLAEDN